MNKMPRLPEMRIDNISAELIPKGFANDGYVTKQKRLYIRENKKFVGYGFIVTLYSWKQQDRVDIIVLDDQLIRYF